MKMNTIGRNIITGSVWSFVGVIIAVLFFYIQEYRNPYSLLVELEDQFNLIEVKENINDLEILYRNENIIENDEVIKIIKIKIQNTGDTILQNYYDEQTLFGIRIYNTKILNAEVLSSNSDVLKQRLIDRIDGNEKQDYSDVILSKLIYDKKDYAIIKITLLQKANEELNIDILGKIANIKNLQIVKKKEESDFKQVIWVYIFAGYMGLFLLLIIVIFITEMISVKKERKKISELEKQSGGLSVKQKEIAVIYIQMNSSNRLLVHNLIKGDNVLNLNVYIEEQKTEISKNIFKSIFLFYRLNFRVLPKEIFTISDNLIKLNAENEKDINFIFNEITKLN